ncbi:MAG: hypothetical protein WC882_00620 [Candidatus Gracilibacteria bacterium]
MPEKPQEIENVEGIEPVDPIRYLAAREKLRRRLLSLMEETNTQVRGTTLSNRRLYGIGGEKPAPMGRTNCTSFVPVVDVGGDPMMIRADTMVMDVSLDQQELDPIRKSSKQLGLPVFIVAEHERGTCGKAPYDDPDSSDFFVVSTFIVDGDRVYVNSKSINEKTILDLNDSNIVWQNFEDPEFRARFKQAKPAYELIGELGEVVVTKEDLFDSDLRLMMRKVRRAREKTQAEAVPEKLKATAPTEVPMPFIPEEHSAGVSEDSSWRTDDEGRERASRMLARTFWAKRAQVPGLIKTLEEQGDWEAFFESEEITIPPPVVKAPEPVKPVPHLKDPAPAVVPPSPPSKQKSIEWNWDLFMIGAAYQIGPHLEQSEVRLDQEIAVAEALKSGHSVLLRGHERVGKSTFCSSLREKKLATETTLHIDLCGERREMNQLGDREVAQYIASRTAGSLSSVVEEMGGSGKPPFEYLNNWLAARGEIMTLSFDEVFSFRKNRENYLECWEYLAGLKHLSNVRLMLVLHAYQGHEEDFSEIFQGFNTFWVHPLSLAETRHLVERPFYGKGVTMTEDAIQEIHEFSGGRPMEIHILCKALFMDASTANRQNLIFTKRDVLEVEAEARKNVEGKFEGSMDTGHGTRDTGHGTLGCRKRILRKCISIPIGRCSKTTFRKFIASWRNFKKRNGGGNACIADKYGIGGRRGERDDQNPRGMV